MKKILVLFAITFCVFAEEKISIAVNTLQPRGVDSTTALVLTDYLSSYLHETGKYQVMERATMNAILKEQAFQQSGTCDDQACMVEMGQLLGVAQMVAGTVSKLGGRFIIQTRLIDIRTGKILQFEKGECTSIADQLDRTVKKIAYAFSGIKMQDDQMTEGKEKKRSNAMLYVGLGGLAVGGGVAAFMLLSDKKEEPQEDNTNERFGDFPSEPTF